MIAIFRDRLARDFFGWAGRRAFAALGLMLAAAMLEGFGILLLIPIIGIVLSGDGSDASGLADAAFAWIGVQGELSRLIIAGGAFAVLAALRQIVLYKRDVLGARLENGFIAEVRRRIFRTIAAQPWEVSAQLQHGRIGHILSRDLDRAATGAYSLLTATSLTIVFTIQIALALAIAPLVTLVILVFGTALFFTLRPLRRRAEQLGHQMRGADYRMFSSLTEFLRGLKQAKAHGLEALYLDRMGTAAQDFADQGLAIRRDTAIAAAILQSTTAVMGLAVVLIGHLWLGVDPARLVVVLIIMARLASPLQRFQAILQMAGHSRTAYQGALEHVAHLQQRAEARPAQPTAAPWPTAPAFDLNGVTWQPEGHPAPLFAPVTGRIAAGSITAIAGPSGVGKTTLCDVMAGLYAPTTGDIHVDGQPRDDAVLARLRAGMAYVAQDGTLLQPTIRAVLTWGTDNPDEDAIWTALDTVGAADLVRAQPQGLDAPILGDVVHLSGGERQRLRLARALLRRPVLIVLDEATNALDADAERTVLEAVFAARNGATVLMISHREEAVQMADHVIRLDPTVTGGATHLQTEGVADP